MIQRVTTILFLMLIVVAVTVVAEDVVKSPTAEQVLTFANVVTNSPETDQAIAAEALQKWMNGKLTNQEAEKYKALLKLPQYGRNQAMGSVEQCAACMAGCCAWWGCNPFCIAGCVEGICKQ